MRPAALHHSHPDPAALSPYLTIVAAQLPHSHHHHARGTATISIDPPAQTLPLDPHLTIVAAQLPHSYHHHACGAVTLGAAGSLVQQPVVFKCFGKPVGGRVDL